MEFTREQHEAVHSDAPRICVDAGAGSGKTRVLVERVVRLVEGGVPLDEIAAITFTDRAAAEMKARLRGAFRARAEAAREDGAAMTRWRALERAVDTARIATIHAFCTGLLKEHALRLGLDPDFAPLDEAAAHLLVRGCVRETLHRLCAAQDPAALALAGTFRLGEIEDLAAGMIARRPVADALLEGLPAGDADAIAARWRAAAAAERAAAIAAVAGRPDAAAHAAALRAFEGLCAEPPDGREQVRRVQLALIDALHAGAAPAIVEAAAAAYEARPRNLAAPKKWPDKETPAALKAAQDAAKDWLDRELPRFVEDAALEAEAAALTAALAQVYGAVRDACDAAKRAANRVSFDDLVLRAADALATDAALCAAAAAGLRHLLIDEFQDTDGLQLQIARALHEAPGGPDLFIVGDAKQSIYLFRGADVEVFRGARRAAARTVPLDTNFRSAPDVLAFVNAYFERSSSLHAVEPRYAPMQARRAPLGLPAIEWFVCSAEEPGASIEAARRAEAAHLAARIAALCAPDGPACVAGGMDGALRAARFGDVAMLFRTLDSLALYEDALRRAGIPYVLGAGAGFYERQEVIDVLDALRAAADPYDEPALLGFLRGPMAALSDDAIVRAVWRAGSLARAALEAPPADEPEAARWAQARGLLDALRARLDAPPGDLLRLLFERSGFEAVLLAQYLGLQKAANLRKLIAQADALARSGVRTLRPFLRYLGDLRGEAVREGEAPMAHEGEAVTLLTIHTSKGLEFPVVVLPDLAPPPGRRGRSGPLAMHRALGIALCPPALEDDAPKPLIAQAIAPRARREERDESARLFYVALTRAKDRLILSGALKRDAKGSLVPPAAGAWLHAIDAAFPFLEQPDGAVVAGRGWQAVVCQRHTAPPAPRTAARAAPPAAADLAALERHAAPLPPRAAAGGGVPVSALLDAMAGGFDEHAPRRDASGDDGDAAARPPAVQAALRRGTLVHAMLQRWEFPANRPPDAGALLDALAAPLGERAMLRAALEAAAARFAASPLAARMAGAARIDREVSFHLPVGGAVVSGAIDVLIDGGATLIDYKTGAPDDARRARYEWQLLLYAAAVRALRGVAPREGLLYYIDHGRIDTVPIDDASLDAALRHTAETIARMRAAAPA